MAQYGGSTYEASPAYGLPFQPMGVVGQPVSAYPPSSQPVADVRVIGYEGVTFQEGDCGQPPPYQQPPVPVSRPTVSPPSIPTHVSDAEARQSLMALASDKCCWGSKPARDMTIESITSSNAFHYKLDTFTEGRQSAWKHEPYVGQIIDGPSNGPAPAPWSIPMQPTKMFDDHQRDIEVPHTAFVKKCHDCSGTGKNQCKKCSGSGKATCSNCNGRGHYNEQNSENNAQQQVSCQRCNKTGKVSCGVCGGNGKVDCSTCKAHCKLKCFIKMTVTWKTHSGDHIVESTALPDALIRTAGGRVVFDDSGMRVAPVSHFQDSSINNASQRLVHQHSTAFPNKHILMQRHNVRVIPVSEVTASYNAQQFTYWVYGIGSTAYAPDYPQQCCCGCTLL